LFIVHPQLLSRVSVLRSVVGCHTGEPIQGYRSPL
jgi:hypothetical protein